VPVRHRVPAAGVKGMTAPYPAQCQPAAAPQAVFADGCDGIFGTRGCKTAPWPQKRAQEPLVRANQSEDDSPHFAFTLRQCLSRLCRSWLFCATAASGLLITTRSTGGKSARCARKDSRMMRFKRFRCTAEPAALREIAIPSRACSPSVCRASTVNRESEDRMLRRNTREKSDGRSRRQRRGNVWAEIMLQIAGCNVVGGSRAESRAALGTAAAQNLASSLGGHAGAESVGALAAQVAGLKCAFHVAYLT